MIEEEDPPATAVPPPPPPAERWSNGPTTRTPSSSPPPFSGQILENVLENVLKFLTDRRDRNAASLVCKSWYAAEAMTRDELFIGNCYAVSPRRAADRFRRVRSIILKGKPRFADFSLLPAGWGAKFSPWCAIAAAAYPSYLEKLWLKRVTVADEDLDLIARTCPHFRDLVLVCCDGFGTAGLASVAENCRHLRVLDLIENDVDDDEEDNLDWISMFPETTTSLESLVFDCVALPVNFDALEALVARSPSLCRLRVNMHVSIYELRRLMARAPQLTDLGTGTFGPLEDGAENQVEEQEIVNLEPYFSASKSLVCLSGFRDISIPHLPSIYPVCGNLTSLNLSFATNIGTEEIKPIIVHCHNLQTFWVLDAIRDEGLKAVAEVCKDLRELRVFPSDPIGMHGQREGVIKVSDIGLAAISEGCKKLTSILYFCQRMSNAAVITMSKNCPDLVVFRLCIIGLHLPDHVTGEPMDKGFGAIVMNCKKLTRLAVSGLLTDKAFAYIGRYGKLVRTLSVAFAGDSDLGLRYVLEGCPKLQKLEIRDSPFGDTGLLSGIHHYYNMRFLWMSSCKLTLRGCTEVAKRLPRLVVEVIKDGGDCEDGETVERLYLYRSLAGPRDDAPPFVQFL